MVASGPGAVDDPRATVAHPGAIWLGTPQGGAIRPSSRALQRILQELGYGRRNRRADRLSVIIKEEVTRGREQGYLVIADISGYTSFLARTELEHAHGIVAELTTLVIARLGEPLRFVELEGDAVFAYEPTAAFGDAERLLDMIEGCSSPSSYAWTGCDGRDPALLGLCSLGPRPKFVAHLRLRAAADATA